MVRDIVKMFVYMQIKQNLLTYDVVAMYLFYQ